MSFYLCNICEINYLNNYYNFDNYIFNIHQIDIRFVINKNYKYYIN